MALFATCRAVVKGFVDRTASSMCSEWHGCWAACVPSSVGFIVAIASLNCFLMSGLENARLGHAASLLGLQVLVPSDTSLQGTMPAAPVTRFLAHRVEGAIAPLAVGRGWSAQLKGISDPARCKRGCGRGFDEAVRIKRRYWNTWRTATCAPRGVVDGRCPTAGCQIRSPSSDHEMSAEITPSSGPRQETEALNA